MNFMKSQRGQNLVEYALIIALISTAIILVLVFLGPRIASIFSQFNTETAEVSPA